VPNAEYSRSFMDTESKASSDYLVVVVSPLCDVAIVDAWLICSHLRYLHSVGNRGDGNSRLHRADRAGACDLPIHAETFL
jgi:hypothetical protein